MAYDSNKGISALASVIQGKAKQAADGIPMSLDFGVINGDFSLKTNTFGKPIPRSDYSVCRLVTGTRLQHLNRAGPDICKTTSTTTEACPAFRNTATMYQCPALKQGTEYLWRGSRMKPS